MIPKIIHYCWYGGQKPARVLSCISSWKDLHPDYEFKEWNEVNSPNHHIVRNNLKKKLWAYVSDYVRLFALYNYGGFYLDTDFYLLKKIDPLRINKAVISFESREWITNGFSGCEKGHPFFKECLNNLSARGHSRLKPYLSPHLTTDIVKKYCEHLEYKEQTIAETTILTAEKFYYYDYETARNRNLKFLISNAPADSIGIHLFMHSWSDSSKKYNTTEKIVVFIRKLQFRFLLFLNLNK